MIRINQIKLPIDTGEDKLNKKIASLLKTKDYSFERIVKKSIDARDKDNLMYIYSVDVKCKNERDVLRKVHNNNIMVTETEKYIFPVKNVFSDNHENAARPVIVGAGPAGYFCGLYLARAGYKPIIIEQGKDVDARTKDVGSFWNGGAINRSSNVSFGEGGAGTFSDGKLNTGIKDKSGRITAFIEDFISFGAPEEIGYINKPHVGTDELINVMKNLRAEIISLGGEVCFETKFIGYKLDNNSISEVIISNASGERVLKTNVLVLAIGHSARDTFVMLYENHVPMEPKSLAIGLRIEHKRETINKSQYGDSDKARLLPAADYKMTYRSKSGRSVYSFCMCPGGYVVNASSDENQSVVNGMSYHDRAADNSNSAIVVGVTPDDYKASGYEGVLAGMYFQQEYEKKAYEEGKGNIPVQTFGDFEDNVPTTKLGSIKPCIKGKYVLANINNCLPSYVNNAIIEAVHEYDKKLKNFYDRNAVLSGIESRTSSPVRIIRNDSLMSSIEGIFPCGEGAGYAGGITSAAVDGIKVSEAVAAYLNTFYEG